MLRDEEVERLTSSARLRQHNRTQRAVQIFSLVRTSG
jgi:hypothetical protein